MIAFSRFQLALGALVLSSCASHQNASYRFAERDSVPVNTPVSFVLVSDTQYAVPFTDYDVKYQVGAQLLGLPPAITTGFASTFYRNAVAHFAVPLAFERVLEREQQAGRQFGLFGGDLAEFSCAGEADEMLARLRKHPALPFIFALGNHDVAFHGSYDTDGVALGGRGQWDRYGFDLWHDVCAHAGGRLTKAGFIERLLNYYEDVWRLPIRKALKLEAGEPFPRGPRLVGSAAAGNWVLDFSFQLGGVDDPQSHRQSSFYQRWRHTESPKSPPNLIVTVLDTTDFGTRPVLCDPESKLVQIGLSGAISDEQVTWLEHEPKPDPKVPELVLSHYLPFEAVETVSDCDSTRGAGCLGKRLAATLPNATYVYAHVHQPFSISSLQQISGEKTCATSGSDEAIPLVRLPSLIDNKSYVVYDGKKFSEEKLASSATLSSADLFSDYKTTCGERVREYQELSRNIDCFSSTEQPATGKRCLPLSEAFSQGKAVVDEICNDNAAAWKAQSGNQALWASWTSEAGACRDWAVTDDWRCILRSLSQRALDDAKLAPEAQHRLGEQILSVTHSVITKKK